MNVGAAQGVAVREFQTDSGPVDYALFVDRRFAASSKQSPKAPLCLLFRAGRTLHGGRAGLSGSGGGTGPLRICRIADRNPVSRPRRSRAGLAPGLRVSSARDARPMAERPATLRRRLQTMPPLNPEGLRDCQVEAANGVEGSLAKTIRARSSRWPPAQARHTRRRHCLRLLAHAGFRRILFLADRANLVRQTRDEYLAYRPPGTGRSFAELYNVQKLGPSGLDQGAQVVIATIQRVYSALTGAPLTEDDEESRRSSATAQKAKRSSPTTPLPDRELRSHRDR